MSELDTNYPQMCRDMDSKSLVENFGWAYHRYHVSEGGVHETERVENLQAELLRRLNGDGWVSVEELIGVLRIAQEEAAQQASHKEQAK